MSNKKLKRFDRFVDFNVTVYNGECLKVLRAMESESVHCCVTSPPYYGLRDYGVDGQIGLEKTPDEYVKKLIKVFREVKRILRPDGTLWLNLGDTYNSAAWGNSDAYFADPKKGGIYTGEKVKNARTVKTKAIPYKNLLGIPWRVALGLQADGWNLRSDIIWHKPNPMPESITDRPTKAHEYLFLFSKQAKYYYDHEAIMEERKHEYKYRYKRPFHVGEKEQNGGGRPGRISNTAGMKKYHEKRNKRTVWTVAVNSFRGAHFATFPEKLIEPCIKAGCPEGGTVLDPFTGSGTTGLVARKYGCKFIGIELNPEYMEIIRKRLETKQADLFQGVL